MVWMIGPTRTVPDSTRTISADVLPKSAGRGFWDEGGHSGGGVGGSTSRASTWEAAKTFRGGPPPQAVPQ